MKDILTVAKFTMKDMLSRKSFRFSTILIVVLIVIGFNIPNIINSTTGGEGFDSNIALVDRDQVFADDIKQFADNDQLVPGTTIVVKSDDDATLAEQIKSGELDSAIIITKEPQSNQIHLQYLVKNAATANAFPTEIIHGLKDAYAIKQLHQQGVTDKDISEKIYPELAVSTSQIDEQEIGGNIFVMMLMSIVLFYAIYFCAYQVSSSITVEKTSKIIETLVTSTSPRNIVIGKTIGIGIVGLLQLILFVATAIVSANLFLNPETIAQVLDVSNITPYLGLMTIIYFILGYFAFALLYALTGSTVNKPEDIQSANTPVALLSMFSFYLAYFTLTDPTSGLNTFAAIFPFSSPFCMPIRIMMGLASGAEVLISIAVLIATILVIARVAIKIYSDAILNYGTKLSLRELINMYKQK